MDDKIKIKHIVGGSTGDKLKGCYFLPASDGTFDFYDKKKDSSGDPLETGIKAGSSFQFELADHPGLQWQLDIADISESEANGDWFGGLVLVRRKGSAADDEGSGTFQAQAGVVLSPEEAASSATA